MTKKLYPILIAIIITTLMLPACNGAAPAPSSGVPTVPAEARAKPTKRPVTRPAEPPTLPPVEQPTATPAQPEAIELTNVTSGLDELNSYKATFTMNFEGMEDGKPQSGTVTITEESVKEPLAKRVTITSMGDMISAAGGQGNDSSIEIIEVGGKQYSKMSSICIPSPAQANVIFDLNSIIGGVKGTQKVGNETVNGITASHYTFDVAGHETLGYLKGKGDMWVAQPDRFVMKYIFEGSSKDNPGIVCDYTNMTPAQFKISCGPGNSEFNFKWAYEVTGVDRPIVILPPENCSDVTEDIPVMDDAQDQVVMGDVTIYTSPTKFEDVVAFYEKGMKAKGWEANDDSSMSAEGVSLKSYTKAGRTVQIIINIDQSSGKTSVTITEEKK